MESYLEVSFLHNLITIMLSVVIAQYTTLQPLSNKRLFCYAFVLSLYGCLTYFSYSIVGSICLEALFFITYFRYAYKTYLMALCIRYVAYATTFVLLIGSFHNGLYFVPMKYEILLIWLCYGLAYALLYHKWKDVFSKLSYVYQSTLFMKQTTLKLPAYLDSGNLVSHEHIPIIFVDQQYLAYFKDQSIELVVMNSITNTTILRCYKCSIQLEGCQKHMVYVHADKHLNLPFNCKVLLNMKVMTLG
ncbi:MAG: sigma-E processing peptidase SpoIIGA [Longicatena sp.]